MIKNLAIIGAGLWGKNLTRNFFELNVLKCVCDLNKEELGSIKEAYPDIEITSSFDNILTDKRIRSIVIATPSETHYSLTKSALEAGKDVFVEKPLALSFVEAKELVDLAEQNKRILMVDHLLRYHPGIIRLKSLIGSDKLGDIKYIYSNRLNIGRLRNKEDVLWSFAPHDISVILYLVGKMPDKINAWGGDLLEKNKHDVVLTRLHFKKDIIAHIFVNWINPFKEQRLVVIGEKGMAVFDDLDNIKLKIYPYKIEWKNGFPTAMKSPFKPVNIDYIEPLKVACSHFIECLTKRETPLTDGRESLKVIKILDRVKTKLDKKDWR
ncbi:MAG: Gfo/Idh/MocA family oxidoreductase [Nanoarchaeota archaeon]|mgnify:CR=1 FL=1